MTMRVRLDKMWRSRYASARDRQASERLLSLPPSVSNQDIFSLFLVDANAFITSDSGLPSVQYTIILRLSTAP